MEPVSRRLFFKQAGTVAAVAGAAVVAPISVGGAGASTLTDTPLGPTEVLGAGEHLVAHVTNVHTGEISLFVGERTVVIHDRKVAARLVRATRRALR